MYVLYRLLGPTAAADVLQLTNTLSVGGGGQARFHLVTNDDVRFMTRQDDDIFEDLFQVCCYDTLEILSLFVVDSQNCHSDKINYSLLNMLNSHL